MNKINDKWYQTYLAIQFSYDLRRYDLADLQPHDLDDLKQDLFLWYAEEIQGLGHYRGVEKRNYLKATNKQAYFNKMLQRRVLNWTIRNGKENKTVSIEHAMAMANTSKGKLDINHWCFRGLKLREKVLLILRFAVNLTREEIADVTHMDRQAVYKAIQRATKVVHDNVAETE